MTAANTAATTRLETAAADDAPTRFPLRLFDRTLADVRHLPDGRFAVTVDGVVRLQLHAIDIDAEQVQLTAEASAPGQLAGDVTGIGRPAPLLPEALLPLLAAQFCYRPVLREVSLQLTCSREFAVACVRAGVAHAMHADGAGWRLHCDRATFWQQPALWLQAPSSAGMALRYAFTGQCRHPQRAPQPQGTVYCRYIPSLHATFSLRVADLARDLDVFHAWMNQDRVHRFWELAGDRDAHAAYLRRQLEDPKGLPLIGEFNGEPFAYLEIYWAKEDRIGPYYAADDFDRGCHVLVGDARHRGPRKVAAWLRGLCHYLLLDDPRTRRVVGEPRVDNLRFINYLQQQGFGKTKEFDFPHKRAALVVLEREVFFDQYGPWGEA